VKIIVSGPHRAGKSTLVKAVLDSCQQFKVGGLMTQPLVVAGEKSGFSLRGFDGRERIFSRRGFFKGNAGTSYRFRPEAFENLGCSLLEQARGADLTVIDELGVMEQPASRFVALVTRLFASQGRALVAVIQQRALDFWLGKIDSRFIDRIYLVTAANRAVILKQIVNDLSRK